jgi:hypothetical protein
LDVSIVAGAILLWALLSHVNWPVAVNPAVPEDCVSFGRAGTRCAEHIERKDGDKPAHGQGCHDLGRAGRICWPEPSPD